MKFKIALVLVLLAAAAAAMGVSYAEEAETIFCGNYGYILAEDGSAVITDYTGEEGELTIPSELDGNPVRGIGDMAFSERGSLTSVTIPDSVIDLGVNPWQNCENLTAVSVSPEHPALAVIDGVLYSKADERLVWCPMNKTGDLAIPQGIRIIGARAFYYCSSLTSVTIPDSVTIIGDAAFIFCMNLTSVTIPDGVTRIGDFAFNLCISLTSVTIPDSVIDLGNNPWRSCDELTAISVSPEHPVLAVIDGVLYSKADKSLIWCPKNKTGDLVIPQGILSIGDSACRFCRNLTGVAIPDSVTSICDYAFCFCSSLSSIAIPDSVTSIGQDAFFACSNLTSVTIPDSVTSILDDAFSDCPDLTITVNEGSYAEQYCVDNGLKYVYADGTDGLNE